MVNISVKFEERGERYIPLWKKLICAGRAAEGLREDWREHLREVQRELGFEYIRFHGIFHEDMMIYNEDKDGNVYYNWQYADKLFDFLMEQNIRPIVELGFMPYKLATKETYGFWWKCNTSPPKDYDKWAGLVKAFVIHFVNRYGMDEVLKWYFEVWNEADGGTSFWTGSMEEYFKLYEYSVKAIKSVNSGLKVGGPASTPPTLEGVAPWVEDLTAFCEANQLPIDFISIHPYPNHWPKDDTGNYITMYKNKDHLYKDLKWLNEAIAASVFKNAEIHLTEWNSSPNPRDFIHDTAFMAPFIIYNNLANIGMSNSLGFWVFTDVFEESRAGETLFHGGFGLINTQGIKKPAYYGYWFLNRLGNEKIASGDGFFVCRNGDKIQILMWNYCHYKQHFCNGDFSGLKEYDRYSIFEEKSDLEFNINIEGLNGEYKVTRYILNRENGSAFEIWMENGALTNPTEDELGLLKKKTGPVGSICVMKNVQESFYETVVIKPHGVYLIEIQKVYS